MNNNEIELNFNPYSFFSRSEEVKNDAIKEAVAIDIPKEKAKLKEDFFSLSKTVATANLDKEDLEIFEKKLIVAELFDLMNQPRYKHDFQKERDYKNLEILFKSNVSKAKNGRLLELFFKSFHIQQFVANQESSRGILSKLKFW
jgi:hypothetical protein